MGQKRLLVTGAAGFMGSHLTDSLIRLKHRVFTVDDLSGGFLENVNPKSQFTKLNLTNTNKTKRYITRIQPEIVFHLAADASEGRSQFMPLDCSKRNYLAYLNVLVPAIDTGVKKIILTSSMSVYGNQKPPFSEEMQTKPVDIYGISKEAMEKATVILSQVHKFHYVIIRPHNVYGPRQNMADPYRNVIGIFINRLLEHKHFFIYGDGKQKRAFTYIDDCTPYIVKAGLENYSGEIFNIGPSEAISINRLAKHILSHFVANPENPPKNLRPVHLPERPVEVKDAYSTNDKAKKLLGFKKTITLGEGIVRTVAWAKKKGHQRFRYVKGLELVSKDTPRTWTDKLL